MRLDLSEQQLAFLYPAYILLDRNLVITGLGPALATLHNKAIRYPLIDHFTWPDEDIGESFSAIAADCKPVLLQLREGNVSLTGGVVEMEEGYLLALNLMPMGDLAAQAHLSDFAPDDPTGALQLVVRMQKAFIAEARDLADTVMREQERSNSILEQVLRAAGNVGHDLNNHLSVISLNAGLLTSGGDSDEKTLRIAKRIGSAAVQGTIISRSLMSIARHGVDKSVRIEVDRVISNQEDFLTTVCGDNMQLQLDLGAPGVWIDVVRPGLINCVVNLLMNAGDASAPGSTTTLRTKHLRGLHPVRLTEVVDLVEISVQDTGSGMAADVLDRAFDPFYSTKNRGSGLGLASVREFAQAMEGTVVATSVVGEGTTIKLTFPCIIEGESLFEGGVEAFSEG